MQPLLNFVRFIADIFRRIYRSCKKEKNALSTGLQASRKRKNGVGQKKTGRWVILAG